MGGPPTLDLGRLGEAAVRRATGLIFFPLGSVVAIRSESPSIALTLDDGPDPDVTPRILKVLESCAATATFFVLMTRCRLHPGTLADILDRGHEVGLHGPDHRRLTGFSGAEVERRLTSARHELEDVSGRDVRWFRPPYGAQSPGTALAIRRSGLTPVLWGPSLWDWKDTSPASRRERALNGLRAGSIVLGHDGIAGPADGAEAGRTPALDRAEWLKTMLSEYQDRGLAVRSLGEVATSGRLVKRPRFVR